jgi:hypothetical protein
MPLVADFSHIHTRKYRNNNFKIVSVEDNEDQNNIHKLRQKLPACMFRNQAVVQEIIVLFITLQAQNPFSKYTHH